MFDVGQSFGNMNSAIQSALAPLSNNIMGKYREAHKTLRDGGVDIGQLNRWLGCLQGCMGKWSNSPNLQRT